MQPRIFFVHAGNETFVRLDRDLLSAANVVQDFYAARKFPIDFAQYWRGVKENDLVFCWFASWNSFWALLIAKIFRKPSILVIGGYDVANLPEANYGHQRGGMGKWISHWAMGLATILTPFSCFSQQEAEKNAAIPANRMRMIYMGVPDPFGSLPQTPKERMALTVGKVDWPNLKRKGIESFVRAAAYLPDASFFVVGAWADDSIEYLRSIATPNVCFTGRVNDDELLDYYRRASVYVQASLHEGFGMSVAEAMLAGCIPVLTKAGSLPEVVGDCGFFCQINSSKEMAELIQSVVDISFPERFRVRERIVAEFPLEKRKELLEQVIYSLQANNSYV